MALKTAHVLSGQVGDVGPGGVVRYRELDTLARRAAGKRASWKLEHDPVFDPPCWTVALLRPAVDQAHEVVARVRAVGW